MRYVFMARVLNVEEKFRVVRVKKDPTDPAGKQVIEEQETLGWFIRIADSSAIGVGLEKPDIERGDTIRITLEKVIGDV